MSCGVQYYFAFCGSTGRRKVKATKVKVSRRGKMIRMRRTVETAKKRERETGQ